MRRNGSEAMPVRLIIPEGPALPRAALPRAAGLEFAFDEKAVARYAVKRGRATWTVIR